MMSDSSIWGDPGIQIRRVVTNYNFGSITTTIHTVITYFSTSTPPTPHFVCHYNVLDEEAHTQSLCTAPVKRHNVWGAVLGKLL